MKTISPARLPGADEDAQAVIRQARRHQRRRRLVTAVVAVLAAGGALGGYAATTGTGHPRSARTVSGTGDRPPARPRTLGIGATMLMWPSAGPESWMSGAYVDDLSTGRLVLRQLPGIIPGDYSPYLVTVGHQLVYVGQHGTTAIAANLTGKPRVLGTTQFFAPSAEPGHVWLLYNRKTAHVARPVPVTGGRPGPTVTLPRETFLAQGTDRGLLLDGPPNGTLLLWTPGHPPTPLPYSPIRIHLFAADARLAAYGTGCKYMTTSSFTYDACPELRVFDVVTGRLDSFRAPPGTTGWVQNGIRPLGMNNGISPRDTMLAAEAVTSPHRGRTRLFVLPLDPRHPNPTAVPASAAILTTMTTWSADGSWLFYQGPGGHLWAYQYATGRARPSTIPCCQYTAMATIPSPP
jgi:hypothetical protein